MDPAAQVDTDRPAPSGRGWVAPYVLAWFGTYLLYATLATWLDGPQFSDNFSALEKAVHHGAVAMGPWLLGFGIGLVVGLLGLAFTWKSANGSQVFWWTALVVCWLFAAVALYASYRVRVSDLAKVEKLAEQKARTHSFALDEVKPAPPPPANPETRKTFSIEEVEEVKPAPPPIIAAITIQDTEGTSEADLSIDALKNLEQMIVATTLKKARARYAELGGDPKSFRPRIDSNAVYLEVGGKKLAVVRINFDNSVRSIAVMGFRGKEFVRVTCLRESNDEIPLFRGTCADKVKEAFGVSLR